MLMAFKSTRQEAIFGAVLKNLGELGYKDELLQKDYAFVDWFQPNNPVRTIPAAAFSQTPHSYDSACIAVVLSNGKCGRPLIVENRALGAPYAFEVTEKEVVHWRVGKDQESSRELLRISPDQIARTFEENRSRWAAPDVLRSKSIGFKLGPRQLDFIDLGLIPALERQISTKLDIILREVIQAAATSNNKLNLRLLYHLIFRILAGKVLHDRAISPFADFTSRDQGKILQEVARYYGEQQPAIVDDETRGLVFSAIWQQLDFRNLSVEVLAYIYENTLVDPETRRDLGTHSTPHAIARYVVHHIPFERLEENQRTILEPFCGHGIFLVAALQRLRQLLDPKMDAVKRHEYFVRMLHGFELDRFAIEVAKLCLMLADFPNHNGWKLTPEDVFRSQAFIPTVRSCNVVLSNPPFGDFTNKERPRYDGLKSFHKPAEFLDRVLKYLPRNGMLGLVLPHKFLDGNGYRETRENLFRQFSSIEITALPDNIFEKSRVESALVIATEARKNGSGRLSVAFTDVAKKDGLKFLEEYAYTRKDGATLKFQEAKKSLKVVLFLEAWNRLADNPRLGESAHIHRGLEWQPPFRENRYVSKEPKPGFEKGIHQAHNLLSFQTPDTVYLSTIQQHRLYSAFDFPWHEPKVLLNAVRRAQGPWRLSAFPDFSKLKASQNFHAIWAKEPWTPNAICAVLNSPLANSFVASHEFQKHILKQTLHNLPLPRLDKHDIALLDRMVTDYISTMNEIEAPLKRAEIEGKAHALLLSIDAFVLKGYGLSPRLEREILDLFAGEQRPVPFSFTAYYPAEFESTIPLWMYLSSEFQQCSASHLLLHLPKITDPALISVLEEVAE